MREARLSYIEFSPSSGSSVDLLVACCGYEARARHVSESQSVVARNTVAYSYPENRVFSYEDNRKHFMGVGEVVDPTSIEDFKLHLRDVLDSTVSGEDTVTIAVDVSSFCRERLACIVLLLAETSSISPVEVVFLYSMATFDSHPAGSPPSIMVNAPLVGFEGWASDPAMPVACVLGLGFEDQMALAALETLEPAHTFAFIGSNIDGRFTERVETENGALIQSGEVTPFVYEMRDPFETLHSIELVVHSLRASHRIAIVPLGPKIFALLALLVATDYRDEVAVWRVSSGGLDPQNRFAEGSVAGIRVHF